MINLFNIKYLFIYLFIYFYTIYQSTTYCKIFDI